MIHMYLLPIRLWDCRLHILCFMFLFRLFLFIIMMVYVNFLHSRLFIMLRKAARFRTAIAAVFSQFRNLCTAIGTFHFFSPQVSFYSIFHKYSSTACFSLHQLPFPV